ncbi:preprotein translocase subunit SecG [Patescibacteria group bacterium]
MKQVLQVIQIISAVILIVLILIQSRGTGFGRPTTSSSSFTRRGLEKIVFRTTFIVASIFAIVSILPLVI